jgi:hypothetical protein
MFKSPEGVRVLLKFNPVIWCFITLNKTGSKALFSCSHAEKKKVAVLKTKKKLRIVTSELNYFG